MVIVSDRALMVVRPFTSFRSFVKKGIRPPASQDEFAIACLPALPDDGLMSRGGDVVVRVRHRQIGRVWRSVKPFRDLLFVAATNVPATHQLLSKDS